ncbi:MAG: winged helix-turn-helix domain-containing protein [Pyrinomonadaceae bacterium]
MSKESKEIYEFGPYRLDVGEHIFERTDGSENGSLPEKAFQTLVVLIRNKGRLVTKNELLDAVWPDAIVEENNLDKSIHAIRNALHDNPTDQKYIETVRKHGYRFVADVKRIESDAKLKEPVTALAEPNIVRNLPDSARHARLSQSGAHKIISLVEWRNIAERLGSNEISQASIFNGEDGNVEKQELDSQVSVDNKEFPSGNSKRFYAQVAAAVAVVVCFAGIGGWLVISSWQPPETPAASATINSAELSSKNFITDPGRSPAYDLYVRGKVKLASENREDTESAIKVLEEAVAIDPNFAEAYAQLARGYNTIAFKYSSDADRKRYHENAEVAIEKALALNPELAEGHFARGLVLWTNTKRFPHEQAIQSYKRSLALDPNLDETHHQLSLVYSHVGLLDEAQQSVKSALEINPNNTLARFRVGVYTAYQGKLDDALAVFKTIPSDFTPLLVDRSTAEALIQTGRLDDAEAIVDEYLSRYPQDEGGSFTSVKALLLAKTGKQKEAEEASVRADQIGNGFGHFHHTAYNIASTYAVLNKPDEAVKWLEVAADGGFPNYTYFEIDPNLNNIRRYPRFIEFMLKLKVQWEKYKALV